MKFRTAVTLSALLALAVVVACSTSNTEVLKVDLDAAVTADDADVLNQGGSASGGTSGIAGNGGGGAGGSKSVAPDTSTWGPCQTIVVPPGLTSPPLKMVPTVAPKCLPAGSEMSRSLALMATSTPQKRHKVKVLFYGQSITKAGWVPATQAYLEAKFPNADFEFREEAIGGFLAQMLIRTAEHDVLPWYPDLMIYHSYTAGNYLEFDAIMQLVRRRTTTEIMQQTHHVTVGSPDVDADVPANKSGDPRESFIQIPSVAKRLGIHVIEMRAPWRAYLAETGKTPQDLTLGTPQAPDGVHPNAQGNALYAKITNGYLKYDPNVVVDPLALVTTYEVGKDVNWNGKKLTLQFDGTALFFRQSQASTTLPMLQLY